MKILTQSIKECLEIEFNKNINDISETDLKNVKSLILNRLDYDGSILNIDYNELAYFENLEHLDIMNCMINEELMKLILSLKKINSLNIYNSDFIDDCNLFFELLNLEKLSISNCIGINDVSFNNLKNLKLKNIVGNIYVNNVKELNIYDLNDNKKNNLIIENVTNLIIKDSNKNLLTKINDKIKNITIVDDKNNVIEVIKND